MAEATKLKEEGLSNGKIFRFRTTCYILTDMLDDGISHSVILTNLIQSVLMKTTTSNVTSFLEKISENSKERTHAKKFYFVATSNLDLNSLKQKSFEINKVKMEFVSFNNAEKQFKISNLFKEWQVFWNA